MQGWFFLPEAAHPYYIHVVILFYVGGGPYLASDPVNAKLTSEVYLHIRP